MGAREMIARTGPKLQSWGIAVSGKDPNALTTEDIKCAVGHIRDALAAEIVLAQYAGHTDKIDGIAGRLAQRLAQRRSDEAWASGKRRPRGTEGGMAPIATAAVFEYLSAQACRFCVGRGEVFRHSTGKHSRTRHFNTVEDLEALHERYPDGTRETCQLCSGVWRSRITKAQRGENIGRSYRGGTARWYEEALKMLAHAEQHGVARVSKALFGGG